MAETALTQLASSGVLGVFLVIVLLALRQKDQDEKAANTGRIEDAKQTLALVTAVQKDVTTAVAALTDVLVELKAQRAALAVSAQDSYRRTGQPR